MKLSARETPIVIRDVDSKQLGMVIRVYAPALEVRRYV